MNILVIDDDKEIRLLLSEIIRRTGHAALTAENGGRALQLAGKQKFDAVFLDIILPDGSGIDLIARLKSLQPKTPIITMTGYSTPEIETKIREQGITVYLSKPLNSSDIQNIINHLTQMSRIATRNRPSIPANMGDDLKNR